MMLTIFLHVHVSNFDFLFISYYLNFVVNNDKRIYCLSLCENINLINGAYIGNLDYCFLLKLNFCYS